MTNPTGPDSEPGAPDGDNVYDPTEDDSSSLDLDRLLHVARVLLYDVTQRLDAGDELAQRAEALRHEIVKTIQSREA